jgi:hypothetical protein
MFETEYVFNIMLGISEARVPTVVSEGFYYRLDVCNLCKLLFQTQFLYLICVFTIKLQKY